MNNPWASLLSEVIQRPLLIVSVVALVALAFIFLLSILNAFTFPRLKSGFPPAQPLVSILVPARNEANNIPGTLTSLLSQEYPTFEVVLLDDHSDDETCLLAQETARGNSRFRLVRGERLPNSWLGKNWACHQLGNLAKGDLLVFTDADITWQPGALSALVTAFQHHRADVFTVWPTQRTVSISERLVVPLMMFVVLGYLPEVFVRFLPFPVFSAANGQCLVFSREAYTRIGGHAAVSNDVVEDVALSRLAKIKKLKLVMSLGNRLITGRMYQDWSTVRRGFAKNILAGHGSSPIFLALSALFHWSLFLFPWIWLLVGFLSTQRELWPAAPLTMILLGLGARAVTAAAAGHRLSDVIWMPVSVVLMTLIAAQSLIWHFRDGGPQWKGRTIGEGSDSAAHSAEHAEHTQDAVEL